MKYLTMVGYLPYSKIIKEQRKRFGLTQEQLAQMLDVTKSTVSRWEKGIRSPSLEMFDRIMRMTGAEIQIISR